MVDVQERRHFFEYLALLRKLRALICEGKGESEEANRLRDRMDEPWRQLTQQEIARIDAWASSEPGLPLTEGEIEALCQWAEGQGNRQIAVELHLSYQTVREHVDRILREIAISE
jgi:DNA-binding NarL/FixJ family response regulator